MKRIKSMVLLCVLCMVGVMAGCSTSDDTNDKITIVCTNFSLYDWTSQLVKSSEAEVILLLNNGADMHSFQPSAEEMIMIADCDMLVHVGGESDAWLKDALEANPNAERIVINLMDVLKDDVQKEYYPDGIGTEHMHADGSVCQVNHEHDTFVEDDMAEAEQEDDAQTETHSRMPAFDEHVWLSLRLALKSCKAIEEGLCSVMPESADDIHANADAYCAELEALDQKYMQIVANSEEECAVIVADRFPFWYMMEDYGVNYYGAFPGCSTEAEADFETVVFLAEKVKEQESGLLLITESGTDTLAQTVFENINTSGETAVLHSIQVVYQSDIEAGATYLGYMEENLKVLEMVLQPE